MIRILVDEPLSAGDRECVEALGRGSAACADMVAAGRAMRDAVAADLARIPGIAVTVAGSQQEAGHASASGPIRTVAPRPHETAVAFVRRQAALHDLCWVVAPESAGLLERLQTAVGSARWIGCTRAAIRLAASKRATCDALQAAGIPTPQAFTPRQDGPWVVKPADGAGALATRRHATHASAQSDLRQRLAAGQAAVLEPWVAGEPLSISMLAGPDFAEAVAFNRQRLQVDAAGWLRDVGVQPAAIAPSDSRALSLSALAGRVAAAIPGLRGFVGIDVVWNEGEGPVVIEVNPRVTCAYVGLSAILRRNLAADILALQAHPRMRDLAAHVGA